MKTVTKLLPGCALALVIAAIAKLLESLEASAGLHLIGASVIALFIGMLVNHFYRPNDATKPGIRFTSKKILKFAIILLGASLNITTVLTVGKFSLTVMLFTLATCFGLGYFIGKALGLNWKTSSLINAGTGICGGSAIAAIAPVIDATDMDVAYGLSATFLFDMVMISMTVSEKRPTVRTVRILRLAPSRMIANFRIFLEVKRIPGFVAALGG